jgi:hypothetical protein
MTKKSQGDDWIIVSGGNDKEYPELKEALLRKVKGLVEEIEQPKKALRKKKEGTR